MYLGLHKNRAGQEDQDGGSDHGMSVRVRLGQRLEKGGEAGLVGI